MPLRCGCRHHDPCKSQRQDLPNHTGERKDSPACPSASVSRTVNAKQIWRATSKLRAIWPIILSSSQQSQTYSARSTAKKQRKALLGAWRLTGLCKNSPPRHSLAFCCRSQRQVWRFKDERRHRLHWIFVRWRSWNVMCFTTYTYTIQTLTVRWTETTIGRSSRDRLFGISTDLGQDYCSCLLHILYYYMICIYSIYIHTVYLYLLLFVLKLPGRQQQQLKKTNYPLFHLVTKRWFLSVKRWFLIDTFQHI